MHLLWDRSKHRIIEIIEITRDQFIDIFGPTKIQWKKIDTSEFENNL